MKLGAAKTEGSLIMIGCGKLASKAIFFFLF